MQKRKDRPATLFSFHHLSPSNSSKFTQTFFTFFDFIVLDWIEFKFNSYDHKTTTTTTHNTKRKRKKGDKSISNELLGFYLRLATNGEGHHWPHHIVLGFYTVEEEIQLLGLLALLYSHQQSASITEIGEEKKKRR